MEGHVVDVKYVRFLKKKKKKRGTTVLGAFNTILNYSTCVCISILDGSWLVDSFDMP